MSIYKSYQLKNKAHPSKTLHLVTFILISLFYSNNLCATHHSGMEIRYEHITGQDYCVYVNVFVNLNERPIALARLCASSSCYPSGMDIPISLITDSVYGSNSSTQSPQLLSFRNCINDSTQTILGVSTYQGCVTLPGICSDWKFTVTGNIMNPAIANVSSPSQISACQTFLNNTKGGNTSPMFTAPPVSAFCVLDSNSSPIVLRQPATEPDGDSLFFRFANPLDISSSTFNCPSLVTKSFIPPFTVNSPMSTQSGISVNHKNGTFTFKPSKAEMILWSMVVEEYRFDNVTLNHYLVGNSVREIVVRISETCSPAVTIGTSPLGTLTDTIVNIQNLSDSLNIPISNSGFIDSSGSASSTNIPRIKVNCGTEKIILGFPNKIRNSSIDPSDFRLVHQNGHVTPIISAVPHPSGNLDLTDSILLKLHTDLDVNGIYYLIIRNGTDGNTLVNECGFSLPPFYLMIIEVNDCPDLKYELLNVSVIDDAFIDIEYDLDTNSFIHENFNSIDLYRKLPSGSFSYLVSNKSLSERRFTDTFLVPQILDETQIEYQLKLVSNGNIRKPSNTVHSILLQGSETGLNTYELNWTNPKNTTYGEAPVYKILRSTHSVGSAPSWQNIKNNGTDTLASVFVREGYIEWYKVVASDPSDSNKLKAISNWIALGIDYTQVPPTITVLPNIFTPNNDGINDRLYFRLVDSENGGRAFTDIGLQVFNRWGKTVFEDQNYTDKNNSTAGWDGRDIQTQSLLSNGTYFYILELSDSFTGLSHRFQGNVAIIR